MSSFINDLPELVGPIEDDMIVIIGVGGDDKIYKVTALELKEYINPAPPLIDHVREEEDGG